MNKADYEYDIDQLIEIESIYNTLKTVDKTLPNEFHLALSNLCDDVLRKYNKFKFVNKNNI